MFAWGDSDDKGYFEKDYPEAIQVISEDLKKFQETEKLVEEFKKLRSKSHHTDLMCWRKFTPKRREFRKKWWNLWPRHDGIFSTLKFMKEQKSRNLALNYWVLDQARQRGMHPEEEISKRSGIPFTFKDLPTPLEKSDVETSIEFWKFIDSDDHDNRPEYRGEMEGWIRDFQVNQNRFGGGPSVLDKGLDIYSNGNKEKRDMLWERFRTRK